MHKEEILNRILKAGIVGVIRLQKLDKLIEALQAVQAGGIHCVEISLNIPEALSLISKAVRQLPDMLIGAGTVLDGEAARAAIFAGAEYLVSPITKLDVIKMAKQYDKVVIPGGLSPTEIHAAWEAGADIVKIFPAARLGPHYIQDLKAPFPCIPLMPTGGINAENATAFFQAGADVICVGSALFDHEVIRKGEFDALTKKAKKLVVAAQTRRASR